MTFPELTAEQRRAAQAQIDRANLVLIANLAAIFWRSPA